MTTAGGAGSGFVAALDVGGTKIDAGVVGPTGEVLSRSRIATPRPAWRDPGAVVPEGISTDDAEDLFSMIVGLLERVIAASAVAVDSIGVGCGGPMDACTVSPLNIGQWRRFPLRRRLESTFGLPVGLDNDAKALALAEGAHGAARGEDDYLAMVVSTGVGGGVVLDGRLLDGHAGNAGHIGHLIVDPLGRRCRCGARGCLEAQVSGTAIAAITGRPAAEAPTEVRVRAGRLVGRAVASVCNLLDLRLAVLAGSVAIGFGAPFIEAAQAELHRSTGLAHSRGSELRIGALGSDGPLVGAACVGRSALPAADPQCSP